MRWVWTGLAFLGMGFVALVVFAVALGPVLVRNGDPVYEPDPALAPAELRAQRAAAPSQSYWFGPRVERRMAFGPSQATPSGESDRRRGYATLRPGRHAYVAYGRRCSDDGSGVYCLTQGWVSTYDRADPVRLSQTVPARAACWHRYREAWVTWCGDWDSPVLLSGTRAAAFFVPLRGDDLNGPPWRSYVGQLRRFDAAAESSRAITLTERFTCEEWATFGPKRQRAVPRPLLPLGACA